MFTRYTKRSGQAPQDDRSSPALSVTTDLAASPDTPGVVLPPRSRYVTSQTAWEVEEESLASPNVPSMVNGQDGGDPAGAVAAATYLVPQQRSTRAPPQAQTPGSQKSQTKGHLPDASMVVVHQRPRPTRPSSARTRPTGSTLFSPEVRPFRKEGLPRPGSAPGGDDQRLKTEIFTLRTPGEEMLHAPALSPRAGSPRFKANQQLQYELGVTASVLRAAQTRLAQEREQRQIARIGEERALESMKRAREEAKLLEASKLEDELKLAKAMAEQRKDLEDSLARIETEQEAMAAGMQAEINVKTEALRKAEEQKESLMNALELKDRGIEAAEEQMQDLRRQKMAVEHAAKEERRTYVERTRILEEQLKAEKGEREKMLETAKRLHIQEVNKTMEAAKSDGQRRLEEEKEKRIEHLTQMAARRMGMQALARGWSGWLDAYMERQRQRRMLQAAGARLAKPRLVASYVHWKQSWTHEQVKRANMSSQQRMAELIQKSTALEVELEHMKVQLAEAHHAMGVTSNEEAERRRMAEEVAAADREKRIEHLTQMAARRMGKKEISKGFESWAEQYFEDLRRKRLLQAAGAKLARPKLVACYAHWMTDWKLEKAAFAQMSHAERLAAEVKKREAADTELTALRNEIAKMREAALAGNAQEAEMRRLMEEKAAAEKEKRVAYLHQRAARRIGQQGLAKGFTAWQDLWAEKRRQERLLRAAGQKLARPKLVACYTHWRHDWKIEVQAARSKTDKQLLAEEVSKRLSLEKSLQRTRDELLEFKKNSGSSAESREAQMRREMEQQAAREREKRIEHLSEMAAKRMGKKEISMGFETWADMYFAALHRKRLLAAAGARLAKPKLVAGYAHWKHDWELEQQMYAKMTLTERAEADRAKLAAAQAELRQMRAELDNARQIMLTGGGREEELKRLAEEEAALEREKRIEHLSKMAARRMGKKELTQGWETWAEKYFEAAHRKRLLQAAGARLAKPKLAAGYAHWRTDWQIEENRKRTKSLKEIYAEDKAALEAELTKTRSELEKMRQAAIVGNAHEEEMKRLAAEEAEREREKRIEHLSKMAARRMGKKELTQGWETWAEKYFEAAHRKRLLQAAGARLAKPKLAAGYAHWRTDWQIEENRKRTKSQSQIFAEDKAALEAENAKLRKELEKARLEALGAATSEADAKRLAELQAEEEREKRVEHLSQMAARRLGKKELSMGFETWAEQYFEELRRRRMLQQAGARLAKPKLMASYAHWRMGWQIEENRKKTKSQSQIFAEDKAALEAENAKLRRELELARLEAIGTAKDEADAKRLAELQAEKEREQRIEHLGQMAAKRMGKKEISMGFETWAEQYFEELHRKRLLAAAGARLAKPKLVAGYAHWKQDWSADMAAKAKMSVKEQLDLEKQKAAEAMVELEKVQMQLEVARKAMLDGTGREEELKRLAEEQAAAEKERRVEHLTQMAARRMGKKEISKGFESWADQYFEQVHRKRLLQQAGSRLAKPKLAACYTHWLQDWKAEMRMQNKVSVRDRLSHERKMREEAEQKNSELRDELAKARKAALDGTGREEELKRLAEEEAAREREKRIEHLTQMAARRMGKKEISRGFEAWADVYFEGLRRRRMLQQAGSRLAKPKLSAGYTHWKRDWEVEKQAFAKMTTNQRLETAQVNLAAAESELRQTKAELAKAREAMLAGTGREEELKRLAEEEAARDREKRIEHLTQMAARRMGKKEISKGFEAWADMYFEAAHRKRLLQAAGARLAKPKLAASYVHWRTDWRIEERRKKTMSQKEIFAADRAMLEGELSTLRAQLAKARQAALDGTAHEEEMKRQAAEQAARDREKRIEHLTQMAARRMGKKEISKGFEAWADMYFEDLRRRRMLQQAAGRLAKPKLSAGYAHWKRDWELEHVKLAKMSQSERLAAEVARREAADAETRRLREDSTRRFDKLQKERDELLAKLTQLDGGRMERELEMQRQLEEEREKRVAHLQRMAARRLGNKDLSRGLSAWQEMYYQKTHQQRLLRAASSRLSKPKLAGGYAHWKHDWEAAEAAKKAEAILATEQNAAQLHARGRSLAAEVARLHDELGRMREAALSGTAREEELKRLAEEEAAAEREKRIEHLSKMAARRMGKKEISMGFETWADMYFENLRRRRLLQQAGSRLAKPKLVSTYAHWKHDWDSERRAFAKMSYKERAEAHKAKLAATEAELSKALTELERARQAALDGTGREEELKRLAEEQAAADKEKRIEHLTQMAARRMGKKEISKGFETWADMYFEDLRRRRMLAQAGSRLARPKLSASYTHWKFDWELENRARSKMTTKQKLDAEKAKRLEADAELSKMRAELERARAAMLAGTGREEELKRLAEEEAARDKEKRIQHLTQMAARRMGKKEISKGFEAWADMYFEDLRRRRMLQQAAGRLAKPKLSAGYAHWKRDWELEMASTAAMTTAQRLEAETAKYNAERKRAMAAEDELAKVTVELIKTRQAALDGTGREEELKRLAEEQAAADKEQRIQHLTQMAARRMGKKEISKGFEAWADMYFEDLRRRRMLQQAAGRLAKPKLSAGYAHWKRDWELELQATAKMTTKQRLQAEQAKLKMADAELAKLRAELDRARQAALDGTGREEELKRLAEEEAARDKEKRIQHLTQMAARRMGKKEISRGFEAWADMYFEDLRRRRMLAAAGSRLAKPKLVAGYRHWKDDWALEQQATAKMTTRQKLAAEIARREEADAQARRARDELGRKLDKTAKERNELLAKLSMLDGGVAERELEMQRQLEEEREKRIAQLQRMAARRLGNKDLSRGLSAWQEMYYQKTHQQRLLRAASSRLSKPKLAACYVHWRRDWEILEASKASANKASNFAAERARRMSLDAELNKLRAELGKAREDIVNGTGREAELKRRAEQDAAAEREKRIEHLTQMAARRMGKKEISMGFESWAEMYFEELRRKRLLAAAASRLAKPKLVAGYAHWKHDWELEQRAFAKMSHQERLQAEQAKLVAADAELAKLRSELNRARQAALDGTAHEDEMRRQAEEKAAAEKEQRIQHLTQMAARRMGKKEISKGFESWADQYFEGLRRRRLLAAAASRLAKPKLVAGYSLWRRDWEFAEATKSQSKRLMTEKAAREAADREARRLRDEYAHKFERAAKERDDLLAKLSKLDGGAAQRELDMQRLLQEEREKRIAQLQRMAARRMGNKDLSRGLSAWQDMYYRRAHQNRLLRAASSRLARPKLVACYSHWRNDWKLAEKAKSASTLLTHEQRAAAAEVKLTSMEAELIRVRSELAEAREAVTRGQGHNEEANRVAEAKRAAEREKRVEHLTQMAVRRLGRKDLSRGMNAWLDAYLARTRIQNMLKQAALRLAKPKLVHCYMHWRHDWELENVLKTKLTSKQRIAAERSLREIAENDVVRVRVELEGRANELGVALEDARAASLEHLRLMKEAVRQATIEKDAAAAMKVRADEAQVAENTAKGALAALEKQQKAAAFEAEKRLAQLMADQRRQLELEWGTIRTELETQLDALRVRLASKGNEPSHAPSKKSSQQSNQTGVRSVKLIYDANIPVALQLKEGLKKSNTRVIDLFRDMDGDEDGRISKKDFRDAFAIMGPEFPPDAVDQTFDSFDPDHSGEIEFNELENALRKAGAPSPVNAKWGKAKAGGVKNTVASVAVAAKKKLKAPPGIKVEETDVEGAGKGEFTSNMRIRADDFFKADEDGNTELDFNEFCGMIKQRRENDGEKPLTKKELQDLFKRLDLDASGTVDLSEYVQWALRESLRESRGRVVDLFREWDKDKSGFIDMDEFGEALATMGFVCKQQDVKTIFRDLDPDGTGQLDYKELNASLRKSLRRKEPAKPGSAGRKR